MLLSCHGKSISCLKSLTLVCSLSSILFFHFFLVLCQGLTLFRPSPSTPYSPPPALILPLQAAGSFLTALYFLSGVKSAPRWQELTGLCCH